MLRFCSNKRYKRRERFCRYVGEDWTFMYLLGRKKKIFMKLTLIWHSEKLDKMNGVLSVFSFSVEWAAFDALRDCTSSKLQLLHWVPEQRVWNRKLNLAFVLSWRPCRQASPQKHACGTRLVANRPIMRNWIQNNLNIITFFSRFLFILYSIKKATEATR